MFLFLPFVFIFNKSRSFLLSLASSLSLSSSVFLFLSFIFLHKINNYPHLPTALHGTALILILIIIPNISILKPTKYPLNSYQITNKLLSNSYLLTLFRCEYGLVSHSLAAAVKVLMREFDILVAQLEHLLSTNRLSLQKMVSIIFVFLRC